MSTPEYATTQALDQVAASLRFEQQSTYNHLIRQNDSIGEKIDELTNAVNKTSLDNAVKMTNLENTINGIGDHVKKLDKTVEGMKGDMDSMKNRIEEVSKAPLEEKVEAHRLTKSRLWSAAGYVGAAVSLPLLKWLWNILLRFFKN